MAGQPTNEWRSVVAALANPDMRRVFGFLAVRQDPTPFLASRSPSRRRHIVAALRSAGLVEGSVDALTLRESVFAELLRHNAPGRAVGIGRFLRDGRITQFPASISEREQLLRWVAGQAIMPNEVIDESTINERLAAFSDDPAVVRRYLVDFAIVERRADGSEYRLVDPGAVLPGGLHDV